MFASQSVNLDETLFVPDPVGLRVWGSNSPSSLCMENNLSELNFGENVLSSCYIRLQERQLSECQDLVQNITNLQRALLDSSYVARGGEKNFSAPPDSFVKIIYENVTAPRHGSKF